MGRPVTITMEKVEAIVRALKANPHATQVTRDIGGVSMSTVVRIAHMAKVELTAGRKTMGRPLSPEQRRRLLEMRQQHPDATEITLAAMVGVSRSTVHRLAPREAGRKRTARGLSAAQRERVPEPRQLHPKATEAELAALAGVSRSSVHRSAPAGVDRWPDKLIGSVRN